MGREVVVVLIVALSACASHSIKPPEPGTPLARVEMHMDEEQVIKILGEPVRTRVYRTGKAWNPFYLGPDRSRVEWTYPDGRVVFSMGHYSGRMKVVEVSPE